MVNPGLPSSSSPSNESTNFRSSHRRANGDVSNPITIPNGSNLNSGKCHSSSSPSLSSSTLSSSSSPSKVSASILENAARLTPLKPCLEYDVCCDESDDDEKVVRTKKYDSFAGPLDEDDTDDDDDEDNLEPIIRRPRSRTISSSSSKTMVVTNGNDIEIETNNIASSTTTNSEHIAVQNITQQAVEIFLTDHAPALLVIESLVWIICGYHEVNYNRRLAMFENICNALRSLDMISQTYRLQSLQSMRNDVSLAFNQTIFKMVRQAMDPKPSPTRRLLLSGFGEQEQVRSSKQLTTSRKLSPSSTVPKYLTFDLSAMEERDRYAEEFEEIREIARGGQFQCIQKV